MTAAAREDLRAELLALEAEDDATRARLAADGSLFEGYHPEMEAVHRRNAARLREVLAELGTWPGRSLVGDDGARAAWRIAKHSIGEPDLLRAVLPLLERAAASGEVAPVEVAMMTDRVRVFEGRPQRYGTQLDWDSTGRWMVPQGEVEDPDGVDGRRRAVGLPPIVWRQEPPAEEPPPADREERERQYLAWLRRTGWRP